MVGVQQARNQSQKVATQSKKGTKTTVGTGSTIIYTVPAGQKAVILNAYWNCVALGANSYIQSKYAGTLARKATGVEASPVQDPAGLITLAAGDTIEFVGDSGSNNGTVNYFFNYQESPA